MGDTKRFDDVMIDIETLSLHKHKALILSIGMIEFDPKSIDGLRVGQAVGIVPYFTEQILKCRRVDIGTQEFWAKQPAEASLHWSEPNWPPLPAPQVCDLIRSFCSDRERIWANGTQFDLCNLEGYAEDFGQAPLWHYQVPRDMRTFVKETPLTRMLSDTNIPGVPHEPIYDCTWQAWQVWSHYAS